MKRLPCKKCGKLSSMCLEHRETGECTALDICKECFQYGECVPLHENVYLNLVEKCVCIPFTQDELEEVIQAMNGDWHWVDRSTGSNVYKKLEKALKDIQGDSFEN